MFFVRVLYEFEYFSFFVDFNLIFLMFWLKIEILNNFKIASNKLQIILDKQSDNIEIAIENFTNFTTQLPDISSKITP